MNFVLMILYVAIISACFWFCIANERTCGERVELRYRIRLMYQDMIWRAACKGEIDSLDHVKYWYLMTKITYNQHRNAILFHQNPFNLYPKELMNALDKFENPNKYVIKDNVVSLENYKITH